MKKEIVDAADVERTRDALKWALDEIDVLSNMLVKWAYPQGMAMVGREDQFDNYRAACAARKQGADVAVEEQVRSEQSERANPNPTSSDVERMREALQKILAIAPPSIDASWGSVVEIAEAALLSLSRGREGECGAGAAALPAQHTAPAASSDDWTAGFKIGIRMGRAHAAVAKHEPAIKLIEQLRDEYIGEHCQSYPDGHYVSTQAQNEYIGYLEDILQLLRTDAKANP
jgi:hypothetical protein